jgi:hypothetical protein
MWPMTFFKLIFLLSHISVSQIFDTIAAYIVFQRVQWYHGFSPSSLKFESVVKMIMNPILHSTQCSSQADSLCKFAFRYWRSVPDFLFFSDSHFFDSSKSRESSERIRTGYLSQGIRMLEPVREVTHRLAILQDHSPSDFINNFKFDHDAYVLIGSVCPWPVYPDSDGIPHFCCKDANSNSMYCRLTNVSPWFRTLEVLCRGFRS